MRLMEFFRNNKFWIVFGGVFLAQFFLLYSSALVVLTWVLVMCDKFNCLFDKVACGVGFGVMYGVMAIFVMELPVRILETWSSEQE